MYSMAAGNDLMVSLSLFYDYWMFGFAYKYQTWVCYNCNCYSVV